MGQGVVGTFSVRLLWNCLSCTIAGKCRHACQKEFFSSRAVIKEFFHILECLDCSSSGLFCLIRFSYIRLWKMILELRYDMGSSHVPGIPSFSNNIAKSLMIIKLLYFFSHFWREIERPFRNTKNKISPKGWCLVKFVDFLKIKFIVITLINDIINFMCTTLWHLYTCLHHLKSTLLLSHVFDPFYPLLIILMGHKNKKNWVTNN